MGQLKTETYNDKRIEFKYTISVNKEGQFSTTIPEEIVKKLEDAGIKTGRNRLKKKGYFINDTLEGLESDIEESMKKYSARELIEEKIVLQYSIDTYCAYCKTKKGNIVPNGYWQAEEDKRRAGDGCKWEEGTIGRNSSEPFGFKVYVKPYKLSVWKFPNGDTHKDYETLDEDEMERWSTLSWLDSICGMSEDFHSEIKEIEYSEKAGLFFKNLILYICGLNDKLKEVFDKEVDIKKMMDKCGDQPLLIFKEIKK